MVLSSCRYHRHHEDHPSQLNFEILQAVKTTYSGISAGFRGTKRQVQITPGGRYLFTGQPRRGRRRGRRYHRPAERGWRGDRALTWVAARAYSPNQFYLDRAVRRSVQPVLASTHNQTVILNSRAAATPFSVIHYSEHYASECFARLFEVILVSSRKMRLVGAILVYFCTLHTLVTGRSITQSPLFQPKNSKIQINSILTNSQVRYKAFNVQQLIFYLRIIYHGDAHIKAFFESKIDDIIYIKSTDSIEHAVILDFPSLWLFTLLHCFSISICKTCIAQCMSKNSWTDSTLEAHHTFENVLPLRVYNLILSVQ